MARRAFTPSQWRRLPRDERLEILAWEHSRAERRERLRATIAEKMPNEFGMLAQIMILLDD